MEEILLLARAMLASVFAVAGLGKLRDLPGTRRALREFGLPGPLAERSALALPVAELVIAAALVPTASARWGALAALVLLLIFMVAIAVNLARGRTPECHCFGQLHSVPADWKTVARNAGLGLIAALVLWQGADVGTADLAWLDRMRDVEIALVLTASLSLVVFAVGSWFMLQLLGQQGRMLLRIESLEELARGPGATPRVSPGARSAPGPAGLPIGSAPPTFELPTPDGKRMTLDALLAAEKPVVLTFMHPQCGPCTELLPDIRQWQRDLGDQLTLAVVSEEEAIDNARKRQRVHIQNLLLQRSGGVSRAYGAHGTPSAVLIDAGGAIASPLANGAGAIRALVRDATVQDRLQDRRAPAVGTAAHDG